MPKSIGEYHTKQLMKMLKSVRAINSNEFREWGERGEGAAIPFTYEELKAELATREHIPNKKEAKKLRQERAKKGF
jgi:hypothetical protein